MACVLVAAAEIGHRREGGGARRGGGKKGGSGEGGGERRRRRWPLDGAAGAIAIAGIGARLLVGAGITLGHRPRLPSWARISLLGLAIEGGLGRGVTLGVEVAVKRSAERAAMLVVVLVHAVSCWATRALRHVSDLSQAACLGGPII